MEVKGTNEEWGGVCNKNFDVADANVICRMLGFPLATGIANDMYGTAPLGNKFILSKLECNGNEESVFDCKHPGEWETKCKKKEIAGVQCGSSKL